MYSDSATFRTTRAISDQKRVDRMLADQARVGDFLKRHPRTLRALGQRGAKFLQASATLNQSMGGVQEARPVIDSSLVAVATQNHLSTISSGSDVAALPRPNFVPAEASNVIPFEPKPTGDLVGAGQASHAATSSR